MAALRLLLLAALVVGVPSALAVSDIPATPATALAETGPLSIRVLSNRADLISGGDALVQIVMPDKATALQQRPTVDDDGRDVSSAFAWRADGRYVGLVEGSPSGRTC